MFTRAAQDIIQKQDIYNQSYLETGLDFYKYSPAFAMFMIPLSKLHKHLAVPIWFLSIFIFFMLSIFLSQEILLAENEAPRASSLERNTERPGSIRTMKGAVLWPRMYEPKSLSLAFYALAILLSLRFLLSVVQRVQSDGLVLFLLSLFFWALWRKKDILAGASLASAAMVKLTPLIFLPYLLWKKRIKAALACLASIVFYLFAPALYLGPGLNLQYLKSWFSVHQKNPVDYLIWYKNQSLLSFLSRLLPQGAPILAIFILLALILFGLILWAAKRSTPTSGFIHLAQLSAILILMILCSPLAWKHTFVHLIIVHLVLLYYLVYLNQKDKTTRLLLAASFILNTVLNPELTKPIAQLVQQYSNVTLGTLLLYIALLRIMFKDAHAGHYSHV